MARMAAIKDGVVVNVIEAEPGFELPGLTLVESNTAGPGDTYAGGVFTRRPVVVPVPEEVTALQARLALATVGKLAAIEAAVASADAATQVWFDRAPVWRRDSPMIASLASAVGLGDGQIDDLFRLAATMS